MRAAVAALAGSLALAAPGDQATATFQAGTLSLTLNYLMTCGQPGPGPLVIRLPAAFRIAHVRVYVRKVERPRTVDGSTVTVELPKPPEVTCMSIAEGTLPVRLVGVRATRGTWVVRAQIRSHAFAAQLRIP